MSRTARTFIYFSLFLALAVLCYLPIRANSPSALALEDGAARTPPMGWNSWNRFGCDVSEQLQGEVRTDSDFWGDVDRHVVRYGARWVPEVIARAEGSFVFTEDGRRILDFTSGQMSSILGHSHPEIVATVRREVANLDHLYSGMLSRPVVAAPIASATSPQQLAELLGALELTLDEAALERLDAAGRAPTD